MLHAQEFAHRAGARKFHVNSISFVQKVFEQKRPFTFDYGTHSLWSVLCSNGPADPFRNVVTSS